MYKFEQFQQLPYELQSSIYSEYDKNLIASRTVNKLSRQLTKQPFLNQICTKPITEKEVNDYVKTYLPNSIYFFYKEYTDDLNIDMGVMKFYLVDVELVLHEDITYNLSFEYVHYDEAYFYFIAKKR